jgi:uncharacterized spore protein YtfJ
MNNSISNIISVTADKAEAALKENSVFGEPITVDGTTIVPVYKLSFGFAGGGFDGISAKKEDSVAGAAGAGITKKPVSYLIIKDGEISVLSADEETKPDWFTKILGFINSQLEEKNNAEE